MWIYQSASGEIMSGDALGLDYNIEKLFKFIYGNWTQIWSSHMKHIVYFHDFIYWPLWQLIVYALVMIYENLVVFFSVYTQ